MIFSPEKYKIELTDVNKELLELKGELGDREAHISLAKFLRQNIYIATHMFCGMKLAPYQEMTLKAWFLRNFNLCVWARGASKSTLAAIFCFLYPIFVPGSKIILSGPSFRTARHIFNELEKMVYSPKGILLSQIFGNASRRNDLFYWNMKFPDGNISEISAIPLSGDKVRGFRANVLIIDEFLLMPKDIVEAVLTPFLSVPMNVGKRMEIREVESALIKAGRLKEEDQVTFDDDTKVIFLSSASYTFEYLYEIYGKWIDEIKSNKPVKSKYFISQLGWEAIPKEMLSQEIIEAARDGGSSHSNFLREYGAQFVNDSDGFYSATKMQNCTIPDCEEPTLLLTGNTDKKYIISVDPNGSNSPNADFFAFGVFELNEETETGTLVHNYAKAGADLKVHIAYFLYLYQSFNPELIVVDSSDFHFIESCNESELFKEAGIHFEFFDFDSDLVGKDYEDMLRHARNKFIKTKSGGCIVYKQYPTSDWIRAANAQLQKCIDFKKIWFASKLAPNEHAFNEAIGSSINCTLIKGSLTDDFQGITIDEKLEGKAVKGFLIDVQDRLIDEVKKQCALIEVKINVTGHQTFDLPTHLKKSSSNERARKDNYTCLLLGNWAIKSFFDLMRVPKEIPTGMFVPVVVY